jgi:UDP-3-O-[3-hydroxymyristoyl] N-acetylglucosamine deacetylase
VKVRAASTPSSTSTEQSETYGYENFPTRDAVKESARLAAELNVRVPKNEAYQQTIRRSVTYAGVGLRSGEVELMRVRPAGAGEGRYFARVAKGTIDASSVEMNSEVTYSDEEAEDALLERVRMALSNDEEAKAETRARAAATRAEAQAKIEAPETGVAGEARARACVDAVVEDVRLSSELKGDGDFVVRGAEHLLSTLEAMGVDNCRIELEGSGEVPILDGSASSYAYDLCKIGLTPAVSSSGAEEPRMAWKLTENVMVQEGDAFMMLNVDDSTKLTYGIDFTYKSTAIDKQWESWTPTEDAPYALHIAPARNFGTLQDFVAYYRAGYIRGGLENCALVANGGEYWNAPLRLNNEPARHKLIDLIGDLSLLAEPGMSGVPVGHVVAYKAGHKLHAKFVRAVAKAAKTKVPAQIWYSGDE